MILMNTFLPFECVEHIFEHVAKYKDMISLLSSSMYYRSFINKVAWDKEPVLVTQEIINLSYYENMTHVYYSELMMRSPPLKSLKKITIDSKKVNLSAFPRMNTITLFNCERLHHELKIYVYIDVYKEEKSIHWFFKNTYITNISVKNRMFVSLIWPPNLNTLSICCGSIVIQDYFLPKYINKLKLKSRAELLADEALGNMDNLIYLELEFMNFKTKLENYELPKHLKTLVLIPGELSPGCFSEGLEEIIFKTCNPYQLTKDIFPKSVKRISFLDGVTDIPRLMKSIPDNLEYLYIAPP